MRIPKPALIGALLLPFTLALFLAGCGGSPIAPGKVAGDGAISPGTLQQLLDKAVAEAGVPGAIVAISVPGQGQWILASGMRDLERSLPMDPGNTVRIGSITKTMMATIVLQLVDEGRLSLDDRLTKWLPETRVPHAAEITIQQLLNHTSGIYNFVRDDAFQAGLLSDPGHDYSPQELIDIALKHQPYFSPGLSWLYSNTNYTLLGLIAETVTGEPLDEVFSKRIFKRLGMHSSVLARTPEMPGGSAQGYYTVNPGGVSGALANWIPALCKRVISTNIDPDAAWAAGDVVSTAGDLLSWSQALATGELLSPGLQKKQREGSQVTLAGHAGIYGLGVALSSDGKWIGHKGEFWGYESGFLSQSGGGSAIVVLANGTNNCVNTDAVAILVQTLSNYVFGLKLDV